MGTRIFRHLVAVSGLLLLAGCGTSRTLSPQDIFKETEIARDQYRGLVYVNGVELGYSMPGELQQRSIITTLNDKGEISASWIDYDESLYGPHALFTTAHDSTALPLTVEVFDRSHGDRDTYPAEHVGIDLPPGYLQAHLQSGMDIQLEGRRGSQIITFGPDYMTGYWQKLQIAQACVRARTC